MKRDRQQKAKHTGTSGREIVATDKVFVFGGPKRQHLTDTEQQRFPLCERYRRVIDSAV